MTPVHVHSANCGCSALRGNAARRYDPTRTGALRARYEAELVRRFRRLAKLVREVVGEHNAFGLQAPIVNQEARPNIPKFDFPRSSDKVSKFMKWLEDQEYAGILETSRGMPMERAAERAWQNIYIRSAYQKGIAQASGLMRRDGVEVSDRWIDAGMLRPIHADRVGLIYTRAYADLEGITDAMDQKVSGALAQGLAEGLGARALAKSLSDKVEGIGVTRARVMARTETIRAHAEGTLNSYEEAGLEGVTVLSEFSSSRDDAVCDECADLEGQTFTLAEAHGIIPVHPNCRCAWLPVVENPKGIVLA